MAAVTIRNLSDEADRTLTLRAGQHDRSADAEMRAILETAVRPKVRLKLGTALAERSQAIGLTNADVEALGEARDTKPAVPIRLEEDARIVEQLVALGEVGMASGVNDAFDIDAFVEEVRAGA